MNESDAKSGVAPPAGNRSVDRTRPDYCRIVDSVPGCILVADAEGQIVYANRVALACLGRSLENLLGAGWLNSLDFSLINEAQKTWRRCVEQQEPLNAIWRFRQHDDTYRWHYLRAEPTVDSDSAAVTWYILGVDVDEQFKAQEALKTSEREVLEILDRVPAMISLRTEEGIAYTKKRLTFINRKVRDYTGFSLEQIRDMERFELIHPEEREEVAREWQRPLPMVLSTKLNVEFERPTACIGGIFAAQNP